MNKAILAWSSGKDSVLALDAILRAGQYEVVSLLSVLVEPEKIGMHNVPLDLVKVQAASLGLTLEQVSIPTNDSEQYDRNMRSYLDRKREQGVGSVIFGDIYLEDLRAERERMLEQAGLEAVFPLWGKDVSVLMRRFIQRGFKAVITNIDTRVLSPSFLGCELDEDFVRRAPASIDLCGENGEYHSFVYDGPLFDRKIDFSTSGTTVLESTTVLENYFHQLVLKRKQL